MSVRRKCRNNQFRILIFNNVRIEALTQINRLELIGV